MKNKSLAFENRVLRNIVTKNADFQAQQNRILRLINPLSNVSFGVLASCPGCGFEPYASPADDACFIVVFFDMADLPNMAEFLMEAAGDMLLFLPLSILQWKLTVVLL